MARTLWKGAIAFGLVHVPVQMYPATRASKPSFHLLDSRSMDPVGYRQFNKRTGKDVARDRIVRGFEYEKNRYVVLSDDELRAANPKSTQSIDVQCFVPAYHVNFLYLDTPYFLAPDRRGEKVYKMFREALADSGKIGIALMVIHDRQHLCALVPTEDAIALNTLRWADEVLDSADIPELQSTALRDASVSTRERDMARRLIDEMAEEFTPTGFKDTFRDDIMALVERKVREGDTEQVDAAQAPVDERSGGADVLDLTELLRRSLGSGRRAAGALKSGRAEGRADPDTDTDTDGADDADDARDKAKAGSEATPKATPKATHTARRTGGSAPARKTGTGGKR